MTHSLKKVKPIALKAPILGKTGISLNNYRQNTLQDRYSFESNYKLLPSTVLDVLNEQKQVEIQEKKRNSTFSISEKP